MENIMMDIRNKNIKIVDFGLSNCFSADQLLHTHCGSPEYAAPELFTTETNYYGPEVDIWSLGINIYAMVCGKLPFTTPHSENRRKQLLKQLQYGLGPLQDKEMSKLSNECRDLLHQCIEPSPELRCPLLDIEVHPWITNNGNLPFYPYQQPRKDRATKLLIMEKMARLLNVNKERIEGSIHEYRLDDVSAIYNLLMDEHLGTTKGSQNKDHTIGHEVKQPHHDWATGETQLSTTEEKQDTNQQTVPKTVRLRTPTVIGMVRPSQTDPERWTLKSADFELRALGHPEQTCLQRRPKTATFHQPSSKAKPMGNATTHNSMIARCHNFGNIAGGTGATSNPMHHYRDKSKCRDNKNTHHACQDHHDGNEGVEQEDTSWCAEDQAPRRVVRFQEEGSHHEDDHPTSSKQSPRVRWCDNDTTHDDGDFTSDQNKGDAQKEVNVIDMVRYFNCKHGYQLRETPQDAPLVYSRLKGEDSTTSKTKSTTGGKTKEAIKLCDDHREQVTSELTESNDTTPQAKNNSKYKQADSMATYRRATPHAGPTLRKEDNSQPPATIDIKLPRHDEGYQSDSESERTRSATPTQKPRWRPRFYQKSRRHPRDIPSPSQHRYTPRADHPRYYNDCITSGSPDGGMIRHNEDPDNESPLYCTPVVSLQTTQDYVPYCIPMQQVNQEEDMTKNRMPQRVHWKKQCPADMPPSAGAKTASAKNPKQNNSTKARELMKANSVHESYPKTGMRFTSAKLRTPSPPKHSSSKPRSSHTAPPHPSHRQGTKDGKQKGAAVHSACKEPSSKTAFKMDKYSSGRSTPSPEQAWTATPDSARNVIDLSKQHMLTLLQEASATLENSTKLAERKQRQSQLHQHHYASHKKEPIKSSWQKAIDQLRPHPHSSTEATSRFEFDRSISPGSGRDKTSSTVRTLGKPRRRYGGMKSGGGIVKELGQRIAYEEELRLNPQTGPPPSIASRTTTEPSPENLFNVDASRDVQSPDWKEGSVNYRLPKMAAEHDHQEHKGWIDVGYFLERKLSNTLKGGDDISKMRRTPYSVNEVT